MKKGFGVEKMACPAGYPAVINEFIL